LLDGPTVRILDRILFDIDRMTTEGRALREEVPALRLDDTAWLDSLRQREASLEDIVISRPSQTARAA
jgi:hypothetical protein